MSEPALPAVDVTVDVAVCGGGIAGLTAAIALARSGLRTVCLDRLAPATHVDPGHDVRTTAIALGSRRLLERIDVWAAMATEASAITDIRIADGASPQTLHFSHRDVGDEPFGHIIENAHLRACLHRAAAETDGLTHLAPVTVRGLSVTGEQARLDLDNGRHLHARLVIGADGRDSFIREAAGITVWSRAYEEQAALVCVIRHARPHHGVALEHFRAAGPFAVLPMTDDPQTGQPRSSIVWTEAASLAPALLEAPEADFIAALSACTGTWLGQIDLASSRALWHLRVQHAHRYIAPRVALVADAAHAIHPIAGQGLNLGLRDVDALVRRVHQAALGGEDIGAERLLRAYQRQRRPDNWSMIAATDSLNALFSTANRPVARLRQMGLAGVAALAPVKRFFMNAAMGQSPTPGAALLTALR